MGKRIKTRIRGKGTPRYRAPSHRYVVDLKYRNYDDIEKAGLLRGKIVDFVDDPGRGALLAKIQYENGESGFLLASEGMIVGNYVEVGAQAKLNPGNVLPLYSIPEGTTVFNLEKLPGDGGRFVRSPGSYALIVSKEGKNVLVKMPSKKLVYFNPECRAQIGVVAGGGVKEKPLLKAGNAYYKWKARNKVWPVTRGVAMSVYDHPYGGKQHHKGRPSTVSRNAPPGQKVGHIAARQTGRKKVREQAEGENK
jgi:large subunit ribosomal protein L2